MLAASGLAQNEAARKIRVYLLEKYYFRAGAQLGLFHDYFSKAGLAALDKVHKGPKIVLEAFIAVPHAPSRRDAGVYLYQRVLEHSRQAQ